MPITDETRKLIFNKLKHHLEKCTPPMVVISDTKDTSYQLIGNKEVPYGYDKNLFRECILRPLPSVRIR